MGETDELITVMAHGREVELHAVTALPCEHDSYFRGLGLSPENSTSNEDCCLLYLLVRHFARRSVFEVGTYVGMTAVAMNEAVKRNGGICTTCDPVDCGALPPSSGIRFLLEPASEALVRFAQEGLQIDFAFFDWVPDAETVRAANYIFTPDAIVAVHDYGNNEKGAAAVAAINTHYRRSKRGRWYYPSPNPVMLGWPPRERLHCFLAP